MKILQIGTTDKSGGAASISWSIKKVLEKMGHVMPMFVADKKSDAEDVFIIPRKTHRYIQYLFSNDIDLSKTDWIINTKEFKEADIIHFHNLHGWFFNLKTLEKMSKLKPIIWTLHDMWPITPHCAHSFGCEIKNGFYQCPSLNSFPRITWHNEQYLMWRKKNIYKNSNFEIVAPSQWLKDKVKKSLLKDKETHLIYNGINENVFKFEDKDKSKNELGLPTDKRIILFLSDGGKNNSFKGWSFLENVLEKFSGDEGVLFISLGGEDDGYDSKYKNLKHVPKTYDKKVISMFFSASDVFLYPSLADNCPLVILEALACQTPIVTFDTGGIPELVKHLENGYIAKYKDADDLISGINYILNLDNDKIKDMGLRSREEIEKRFTEDIMIHNYLDLYKEILEKYKITNKI